MTTPWQTFLCSRNAQLADNQVQHFGDSSAELRATADAKTILADLSHLGLLQVSGDDRVNFLQGQLTNDVQQLNGCNSQYAGYCTPKGRLLALFLAFAQHEQIYLQLNRSLLAAIAKRLQMYVLRAKVKISDVSDSLVRLGLAGSQAEAVLRARFSRIPDQDYALCSSNDALLLRLPGPTARYEIVVPAEHAEQTWLALSAETIAVGAPCWEWLEIKAGIPDVSSATQEAFVPQMINLDALGAINYKKGCYTGQEIVARTHYLGKVKRRTLAVQSQPGVEARAGDALYAAGGSGPVGTLVRVAPAPGGGFSALAELRLAAIEEARIHLDAAASSPALEFFDLPYSLEQ